MSKGNKKLLIVIALLLIVGLSISTYALYKSSATGEASATVADWKVKVNTTSIVTNNEFTISDINWETNDNVKSGLIAPGSTGTLTLLIDATDSETSVNYSINADTTELSNDNFTLTAATGSSLTGSVAYGETKSVTLNITWDADDSTDSNTADMALKGSNIKIPITVTATQKIN